jgi:Protein of unknown function (DUF2867)
VLDPRQHFIDAGALPGVEHLGKQGGAVSEVPVEAALGDAERLGQRLDPDSIGTTGRKGPKPLFNPSSWGRAGRWHLFLSRVLHEVQRRPLYAFVYMRYRITRMRLPNTAHTSRPWRIHELTPDFRLEDVWELPGVGGPDDFPRLVALMASLDPSQGSSRAARVLWAIRWKVGALLGWDDPGTGLGSRVPTLRERLPADLRDAPTGPEFDALPFTSLYLLEDEWAAEIANQTMHGVMHISRIPDDTGGFRARMAVLVKPNGLLGHAYMAAIRPFRHLIVYPPMMRDGERAWHER